jgi:hypothetical protein
VAIKAAHIIARQDAAFVFKLNPLAAGFQAYSERISAYDVMCTATPNCKTNFQFKHLKYSRRKK